MQEFCNGGSLRDALAAGLFNRQNMPLRWAPTMAVLLDVARGMAYMHGKRICHGDLNPANVLFKVRSCLLLSPSPCLSAHSFSPMACTSHATRAGRMNAACSATAVAHHDECLLSLSFWVVGTRSARPCVHKCTPNTCMPPASGHKRVRCSLTTVCTRA